MPASYFLAPSWDINPEDVVLGSIIASVKSPTKALSTASLPESIDAPLPPPKEESPFSGVAKTSKQWSAGLFSTFLQVITLGGEISLSSATTFEVKYSCESSTTRRFIPSNAYIANAAKDAGVKEYLSMGGLGAKVFMITGIKTVRNITITTTEEEKRDVKLQLGLQVPGIQAAVGPKGSRETGNLRQCTRSIEGPIVFAFQVEKIRVNRKGKASHKDYIDGAMLSHLDSVEGDFIIESAGQSLEEDEIEDYDVNVKAGVDEDTGETCEIVY